MSRHIYYYTHLQVPCQVGVSVLSGDPARWLPPPARGRGQWWEVSLSADGALPAGAELLPALVEVGQAVPHDSGLLRAVRWRPEDMRSPLARLEADLELAPLQGEGCHLSLFGTYRGSVSVAGPDTGGHRLMEASVRRFLLDIAGRLEAATLPA